MGGAAAIAATIAWDPVAAGHRERIGAALEGSADERLDIQGADLSSSFDCCVRGPRRASLRTPRLPVTGSAGPDTAPGGAGAGASGASRARTASPGRRQRREQAAHDEQIHQPFLRPRRAPTSAPASASTACRGRPRAQSSPQGSVRRRLGDEDQVQHDHAAWELAHRHDEGQRDVAPAHHEREDRPLRRRLIGSHRDEPPAALDRDAERFDLAIYAAIARTPTPALDDAMSRLSRAANYSRLGWPSRRPAGSRRRKHRPPGGRRGPRLGGGDIGVVNAAVKPLGAPAPPRPARRPGPLARHVPMPSSRSFPSGHSAGAFAFATGVGHVSPAIARPPPRTRRAGRLFARPHRRALSRRRAGRCLDRHRAGTAHDIRGRPPPACPHGLRPVAAIKAIVALMIFARNPVGPPGHPGRDAERHAGAALDPRPSTLVDHRDDHRLAGHLQPLGGRPQKLGATPQWPEVADFRPAPSAQGSRPSRFRHPHG